MKVILASASPRRKVFMGMLGIPFEVIVSDVDEEPAKREISDPVELTRKLAELKAEAVADKTSGNAIVIGADTVAAFDGKVIGKARDEESAFKTLKAYSGKEHRQITGFCIINTKTGKKIIDHEETKTTVRNLTDEKINDYIKTGEPMQGSGAYTPRAHPMLFEKISGSWTNIAGLPMGKLIPRLGELMED